MRSFGEHSVAGRQEGKKGSRKDTRGKYREKGTGSRRRGRCRESPGKGREEPPAVARNPVPLCQGAPLYVSVDVTYA